MRVMPSLILLWKRRGSVGKSGLHRKKNECAEHEKVMKKMRKGYHTEIIPHTQAQ